MDEGAAGAADAEDSSRTVAVDRRTLFPSVVEAPPSAPVVPQPVPPAPVPVEAAPAPREAALEDFVMDPAWADEASLAGPPVASPPALDLDSLLTGEEPAAPVPVVPVPSAPAPAPVPVAAAPPPPAPPAPAAPAAPAARTPTRPVAAVPPVTAPRPSPSAASPTPPPQRAVIDDTRARPTPRPFPVPPRREEPEGVMDWARGTRRRPGRGVARGRVAGPVRASDRPRCPAPRRNRGRGKLLPLIGAVVVAAALGGGYFAWKASSKPQIDSVTPARAAAGNVITLTGSHLGESAGETSVLRRRPARARRAGGGGRLQIEVPEIATAGGHDASVPIVVTSGGRASEPAPLAVYLAPLLKTLLPDVAMPGENVVLTGTALGPGATVKFGDVPAQVVQAANGSLTVTVPALEARPGRRWPGGLHGRRAVQRAQADDRAGAAGDRHRAAVGVAGGRRHHRRPRIRLAAPRQPRDRAARPRSLVNAGPRGLEFVVPRVIAGGETVAIAVAGHTHVGQEEISITELPEPVGFPFFAEPFEDVPGHEHALVSSGLGPAFVLTTANGKPAAVRAFEAQKALNEAAQVLRSTRTAEIRARYAPSPAVYLFPRDTCCSTWHRRRRRGLQRGLGAQGGPGGRRHARPPRHLVGSGGPRPRAPPVARGEAVPRAGPGPGRQGARRPARRGRRTVAVGVPSALIAGAKAPMRESLRAIALRVPATVEAPSAVPSRSRARRPPPPSPVAPAFRLDGRWRGSETENGVRKPINMVFEGTSGTLTYERALSMSVPVLSVHQPQKGAIRFEIRVGGGSASTAASGTAPGSPGR